MAPHQGRAAARRPPSTCVTCDPLQVEELTERKRGVLECQQPGDVSVALCNLKPELDGFAAVVA